MDSSLAVVSTAQVRGHLTGEGPGGVEMGEACGAGFSPAGRRATLSTPRCENGVGGLPWRCVCKVGCGGRAEETVALHSHLARHDAGRRLWARAGQLDCPRAPGEGHVQLRHQASVVAGAGEKGRGGKG